MSLAPELSANTSQGWLFLLMSLPWSIDNSRHTGLEGPGFDFRESIFAVKCARLIDYDNLTSSPEQRPTTCHD